MKRKGDDENSSPLDADEFKKKTTGHSVDRVVRLGPAILFLGLFWYLISHNGKSSMDLAKSGTSLKLKKLEASTVFIPDLSRAFDKYEGCSVKWTPPPPKTAWDTKPIWLPASPGSGSSGPTGKGDILKSLINGVTGMKSAAKFYHASSKKLKRCHGIDETVTCSNGHPVVSVGPEKQADDFSSSVLLVIRNYMVVFPISFFDKAEAYHGATEQPSETEFKKVRDIYFVNGFEAWKNLIITWKQMQEYDIGMYIQYEALMDPDRGPPTLQRIADQLKTAGFSVAPKEDIPCIWFQAVKEEPARLREYLNYIPRYTTTQRDVILDDLKKFQHEVADDTELVSILKEYYKAIKDYEPVE